MSKRLVYLDTSAWIKLYLNEAEKEAVQGLVADSQRVATNLLAYPELVAGLAKAERMQRVTAAYKQAAIAAAEADLDSFLLITPTLALCKRAAHLADRFGLRGYDSVHLAAAEALMIQIMPQKLLFASYDAALNTAAQALGMDVAKA
jgi:uncharacterized protein